MHTKLIESLERRILFSGSADLFHTSAILPSSAVADTVDVGAAAAAGGKAVFYFGNPQGVVDVYDSASRQLTTTQLSDPGVPGVAASAAGLVVLTEPVHDCAPSSKLQVFDVLHNRWARSHLGRAGTWTSAATVGPNVVFLSPQNSQQEFLEFYNPRTRSSRTVWLPKVFRPTTIIAVGTKLLLTDGSINKNEIYDTLSKTFSAASPLPIGTDSWAVLGASVIFFDGQTSTTYDSVTGTIATVAVGDNRDGVSGAAVGTKAIFAGGAVGNNGVADFTSEADIYDSTTGFWSNTNLTVPRFRIQTATAGNAAVFAEGATTIGTSQSLILSNTIDIFSDTNPSYVLSGGLAGTIGHRDKVTVINTGDADLPAGYTIQLYATTDRTLSNVIIVGSLNVNSALAAGASSSPFSVRSVIPRGMPGGTYHLLAAVQDSTGHITPIAAEDAVFKVRGPAARPSGSRPSAASGAVRRSPFASTRIQMVDR